MRLRFGDYARATRSHTLPLPTASTHVILTVERALLAAALPVLEHRGVTLVGVAVANLQDAVPGQLALPLDVRESAELDAALDEIHDRYGSSAVTRAVLLGRPAGLAMPLLPD